MLPITGPTQDRWANNIDGPNSYFRLRYKYKQAKPYDLNLAYSAIRIVTTKAMLFGGATTYGGMANASTVKAPWQLYTSQGTVEKYLTSQKNEAINTCRAKFSSLLGSSSLIMTNLIEAKQSMNMLTKRVVQMHSFIKALNKFDIHGAYKALGFSPYKGGWASDAEILRAAQRKQRNRSTPLAWNKQPRVRKEINRKIWDAKKKLYVHPKSVADLFLEFHFGWEPIVKDVYSVCDLLSSDPPDELIKSRGRSQSVSIPFIRYISWGTTYHEWQQSQMDGYVRCEMGATVEVANANLHLAERMGLINPASWVFEAITLSFVADWFVNISQFIGQWSEFSGLLLKDPYYTISSKLDCTARYTADRIVAPTYHKGWVVSSHQDWILRTRGIPSVTLKLKAPWRVSPVRAATAIALLIQALPKDRQSSINKL